MNKPHKARKRFGQNFLVDDNAIFQIVDSIHPTPQDNLVEIGPGLGALTRPILDRAKTLTAIELDRDLVENLRSLKGLTVISDDVLNVKLNTLCPEDEKLRVIGNLPYNISTPIIFHLLQYTDRIKDMHFMLQKEVVERMSAEPNNRSYGRLSVMVQRYCEVIPLLDIPPTAFDPTPKVMSQIVRLIPRASDFYSIEDEEIFADTVKAAFSMKRKMIRNNLKELLTETELESCGITPTLRAENLTIEDFITVANFIARNAKGIQ